jgi:branched-chain amino acid aminotransferase
VSTAAWFAGTLVDPTRGGLALDDHGLTAGDGCFEMVAVTGCGQPFALTRHLERLERSCRGLGLPAPDRDEVRRACAELLAARIGVGCLRIVVTAGRGPLGSGRGAGATTSTLTVLAATAPSFAPTARVVTGPWIRNERSPITGLKTTSYAENVVALAWAHDQGADEVLFRNSRGELCEGSGTNVVCLVDGRFVTPPLSSGCLAGTTRALLLDAGAIREQTVLETDHIEAMALTSSTRGVHPVSNLDARPIDVTRVRPLVEAWATIQRGPTDP